MLHWYLRCLGIIANEAHDRRMVLHPGILCGHCGNLVYKALLDALVILTGHGRHTALQQSGVREGARIIASLKAADHAGNGINRGGVERMPNGGDTLILKFLDGCCDLVTEIDRTDTLIALLNARWLSLDKNFEPDPSNTSRLDGKITGFPRNAGVGGITTDNRVERSVPTDLFIDHNIYENVALQLDARSL